MPFERASAANGIDPEKNTVVDTSVTSDPSLSILQDAWFVVFDLKRGLDILGASPVVQRMFGSRNDSIHETPVYVLGPNAIIFSLLR